MRRGFGPHSPSKRPGGAAFAEPVSPGGVDAASEPPTSPAITPSSPGSGGVFSLMDKVDVNGRHAHPVFLFLKQSCEGVQIRWNFGAYFLVSRDGSVEGVSRTSPAALTDRVEALLSQ